MIEPQTGYYWMKFPGCRWEIVYLCFSKETNGWRISFMGSDDDASLNSEFEDADFVEIKEPVI